MARKRYIKVMFEEETATRFRQHVDVLRELKGDLNITFSDVLETMMDNDQKSIPREGIIDFYARRKFVVEDGRIKVI